eukprot:132878_1
MGVREYFQNMFKSSVAEKPPAWRYWMATVHCILCMITGQIIYTWPLYKSKLQETMGYGGAYGYIYQVGQVGYATGNVMTGKVMELGGPALALVIGGVVSGLGGCLTVFALLKWIPAPLPLMFMYAAIAGFGQGLMFQVGVTTNSRNASEEYRAVIVGVTMAGAISSSFIFAAVFNGAFQSGPEVNIEEDIVGFWMFLTAVLIGTSFLGALHIRRWSGNDETVVAATKDVESPKPVEKTADLRKLLTPSYLSLLFMYTIFKAGDKTYNSVLGNFKDAFQSFGLDATFKTKHLMIMSLIGASMRVLFGIFMAVFTIPTWVYMVGALNLLLISDTFLAFSCSMQFFVFNYLSTILHGMASFMYAVVPKTVSDRIGPENMANGWGLCIASSTLAQFGYQWWNGKVLDENSLPQDASGKCSNGVACFNTSFLISSILLAIALAVLLLFGRGQQTKPTIERSKSRRLSVEDAELVSME